MCDYYRGSEAMGVCSMLLEKYTSSQSQYDVLELYLCCVNNVISHDFDSCNVRMEKRFEFSPFLLLYHLNSPLLPVYII